MAEALTVRTESIKDGDPNYCWVNIELGGTRVGKARIMKIYSRIIIKTITIFPEFQKRGYARRVVELFKETAREIVADRVRDTARGFWEHVGFSDMEDGTYKWVSARRRR